jgi:hypothetical protein
MFKSVYKLAPQYISDLVQYHVPQRALRSSALPSLAYWSSHVFALILSVVGRSRP